MDKPETQPVSTDGKISDDYAAKIRRWAANPRVIPLPPGPPIPKFGVKRFRSHAEMNAWKEELLKQIAANSGG